MGSEAGLLLGSRALLVWYSVSLFFFSTSRAPSQVFTEVLHFSDFPAGTMTHKQITKQAQNSFQAKSRGLETLVATRASTW